MYAFRKIFTQDVGYYVWPTTINTLVTYDSSKYYDDFLSDGLNITTVNGNYNTLEGDTWAVVSYDESDLIESSNPTLTVVSQLTIVYTCETPDSTFKSYFDLNSLDSESAYQWATYIGDIDIMSDNITDESVMGRWVKYINPADHDKFITQITTPQWAYWWATEIGDVDVMKPKINDSMYSFYWALNHPEDQAEMQQYVTEQPWIDYWTQLIGPMN